MIEAVNSVLASAPLLRGNAEQSSSARSAEIQAVSQVTQAPYISPFVVVDNNFDKAVLQIRDSATGDVLRQFPSEQRLEEIRRQQAASETIRESRRSQQQVDVEFETQTPEPSQPRSAPAPVSSETISNAQVASAALASAAQSSQQANSTVSVTA